MTVPLRILRADAQDLDPTPRFLTQKEINCRDRIAKICEGLFARHGTHIFSFRLLADSLEISPYMLRRHYPDVVSVLGDLISTHLADIFSAVCAIPADAPDAPRRRRAAYLKKTRTLLGVTYLHMLYTRDRHLLPEDLLDPIEAQRGHIGEQLGDDGERILSLLDLPCFDAAAIDAMLAHLPPPAWPKTVDETVVETVDEPGAEPPKAALLEPLPKPAPARRTRSLPELVLPDYTGPTLPPFQTTIDPDQKPGDWIYNCGLPGTGPPQ